MSIIGSVNRPGTYPLDKFSSLKDLVIEAANNVLPRTYLRKVDVSKENLDGSRSFTSYDLSRVLEGSLEVKLEDQDEIRIFSLDEIQGDDNVSITGFGISDTISIPWRENLKLYDFVFSNSPFEEKEFTADFLRSRIDVKRFNKESGLFYTIPLDIDEDKNFILMPKDNIFLYSRDVTENLSPNYQISGFVNNPGTFDLDSSLTVEDAILKANGLAEFADVSRVAVYSLDEKSPLKSSVLKYVSIDLDYINGKSKKPKKLNLIKPFDRINLYKDPNIKDIITLEVRGEVNSPGTITFEDLIESMSSVINKAGGLTDFSSLESSYIIRDEELLNFNFKILIRKRLS